MSKKNGNSLNGKNIEVRKEIVVHLNEKISKMNKTQVELSKILEITQPRVSDLIKLKIEKFSLDALVNMAYKLGYDVQFFLKNK